MRKDLPVATEPSAPAGPDPPAADAIGPRVVAGLAQIARALRHHARREARGLSPAQGQILALLRAHPRRSLRVGEVAAALAVTAPTASVAIGALERKGLVHKTPAGGDARGRVIALTGDGEREALRTAAWGDFLLRAVAALPEAEQVALDRSLRILLRTLQEREHLPGSGPD